MRSLHCASSLMSLLAVGALLCAGCAHERVVPKLEGTPPPAEAEGYRGAGVSIAADLLAACKIHFDDIDRAPRFDFDTSDLSPTDRVVLDAVARCVTTGPLKGRSLGLIGRADPRGELEYNFVLGEHRAGSVERYLSDLGVEKGRMRETSRGELDASGHDEEGWSRDRRVDIRLQ